MTASSPSEIHDLFRDAFNRGDVEALVALYEPNAILAVGFTTVSGREEIRRAFESILELRGRMTLETRSIVESQQGLAVLHGRWVLERVLASGAGLVTTGLSTEVVRKQSDGSWLFVIDNPYTPERP